MSVKEKIENLRKELHQHNYNYYVLNAPQIDDFTFDALLHELQSLENAHPEMYDANSPLPCNEWEAICKSLLSKWRMFIPCYHSRILIISKKLQIFTTPFQSY